MTAGARAGGPVDFEALFRAIPTAYLVMTPDLVIVEANGAYLASVGRTREQLVGVPVFEAFPPAPDALDDSGVSRVQRSFERARDTGQPDTMPVQRYDIPDVGTGTLVTRFWSLISVPVLDEQGRTALVVQRAEDITDFVDARDRASAGEDAAWRRRVEEVEADLYARAQDLSAALQAEELAGRRLARLAEVALQLTAAESLDDLESIVVGRGLPVLDAAGGAIVVPDRERGGWRLASSSTLGQDIAVTYGHAPQGSAFPACWTARTGTRLLLPDRRSGLEFSAGMAQVHADTGCCAWAFLPLRVGDELLGSLAVAWVAERSLSAEELELLDGFAAQLSQALQRIRATEAQRAAALAAQRMSETLQRSLLTSPPSPPGLHIAVRYQPAAQEAQVGGDWYDAFVTAGGSTLLVVGDITGHDRIAAAAMGQVRNLLRGMAWDSDDSPAVLLARLDGALRGLDLDTLATAVLARVEQTDDDRDTGVRRLRWSNAGHPPPLLRTPSGEVRVLDASPDLLLGLDPATSRGERVTVLEPGSTLLLYSDGLVERRAESLDDGIARLAGLLAERGGVGPEQLCDLLVATVGPDSADDIVLLVLAVGD